MMFFGAVLRLIMAFSSQALRIFCRAFFGKCGHSTEWANAVARTECARREFFALPLAKNESACKSKRIVADESQLRHIASISSTGSTKNPLLHDARDAILTKRR